jgi:hypothetical protein
MTLAPAKHQPYVKDSIERVSAVDRSLPSQSLLL